MPKLCSLRLVKHDTATFTHTHYTEVSGGFSTVKKQSLEKIHQMIMAITSGQQGI